MTTPFKVVIVGGSIAGLTLAHCLHHAGIDYTLLEKRAEIAPQEGASVGVMPNGARILDQLGLYDAVEALIEPLESAYVGYPDGFKISSLYPRLLRERFGYPLAFLDRQKLLQILADSLPDYASRVCTGKAAVQLIEGPKRASVVTADGSVYEGDIIVGADGIHSKVRGEMWRLSRMAQPGTVPPTDQESFQCEYSCVFGISSANPKLEPGTQINRYNDGWSILCVIGKEGRVFWFLFLHLGARYAYGSAPRFSEADARQRCELLVDEPFWKDVPFGDIWRTREVCTMVPLEEGVLSRWHWGCIICVGDSVHKIAPHTGQGANCAMEDVAALANRLRTWRDCRANGETETTTTSPTLDQMLGEFVADRKARMQFISQSAHFAMRLHARKGILNKLIGRYYLPLAGDLPANQASKGIAAGVCIDYLPLPSRNGPGWIQFGGPSSEVRSSWVKSIALVLSLVLISGWLGMRADYITPCFISLCINDG